MSKANQVEPAPHAEDPICPRCGKPVAPYHFKSERDGVVWHERCLWAQEHGVPEGYS